MVGSPTAPLLVVVAVQQVEASLEQQVGHQKGERHEGSPSPLAARRSVNGVLRLIRQFSSSLLLLSMEATLSSQQPKEILVSQPGSFFESGRLLRWALYGAGITAGAAACWFLYKTSGKLLHIFLCCSALIGHNCQCDGEHGYSYLLVLKYSLQIPRKSAMLVLKNISRKKR